MATNLAAIAGELGTLLAKQGRRNLAVVASKLAKGQQQAQAQWNSASKRLYSTTEGKGIPYDKLTIGTSTSPKNFISFAVLL